MEATCLALIRLCKKCGKPCGLRGMYVDANGNTIMASKYCGPTKDDSHDYTENKNNDNKVLITIPWPYKPVQGTI